MKKNILNLMIVICLCMFTKYYSQNGQVTMSPNMVITVYADQIDQLSESYTLDIPDLTFKSEKDLQKFCKVMSFDFYTLSGDYETKQMKISFNKKSLLERQFTIEKMNTFFLHLSGRLKSVYKKINQL
ncbi:hypothetical protein [Chryseobacterium daecheongense]|uniref:Uncharacterized protein n=2 Tax=Chryseobacterium daecheongense TaxID=192389 RepID=A0ABY2FWT9_9FLAO|nr:hypothetical protein [Chryseobacterium daecheongense]TDX92766.1 hypothetical protein BCF50_1706 [Chryseobacterium daecheongense]